MSAVLNIYKKTLELLSPQEQVVEINNLIHYLNTTKFNIKYYAFSRKYERLSQLNKMKKDLMKENKINYTIAIS